MARQRDEQKRELIIETAVKLFSTKGYHATSIQDIVAESGLSVGTIYLYFQNKEEIFDSLLDRGMEIFSNDLFRGISTDNTDQEKAEIFVSNIFDSLYENINIVTVLTNELGFQKKLLGFYDEIAHILAHRFMGIGSDADSIYRLLNMSREDLFAFVTIILSGLTNAIRLSVSDSSLTGPEDIRRVLNKIVLPGIMNRIV